MVAEKYRLEELLGEGGMGAVFRARHVALDSLVAIKLVRRDVELGGVARRLLIEAQAGAKLDHPSIVRVLDLGTTASGEPFLVMELLQGQTLREHLQSAGRLDAVRAVRLLLPVIDGLSVAHDAGVVHRDLKPDNIFLSCGQDDVCPKILDFGIAKVANAPSSPRLTHHGTVLGSPLYMAPEQALGLDVDHRADVWTLCVVLYEAISGKSPFLADSVSAVMMAVVAEDPVPLTSFSVGDDVLSSILARGLDKDPGKRWGTVRELGDALSAWLEREHARRLEDPDDDHETSATASIEAPSVTESPLSFDRSGRERTVRRMSVAFAGTGGMLLGFIAAALAGAPPIFDSNGAPPVAVEVTAHPAQPPSPAVVTTSTVVTPTTYRLVSPGQPPRRPPIRPNEGPAALLEVIAAPATGDGLHLPQMPPSVAAGPRAALAPIATHTDDRSAPSSEKL